MTFQVDQCIEKCFKGNIIPILSLISLCNFVKEQLVQLPNVVSVQSPVIVCGDLHGQFHDLLELFQQNGQLSEKTNVKYIFLGDYVDRGPMSVEIMTLLFCYIVKYPNRITLIRGNHECRTTSQVYGFYAECNKKYDGDQRAWKAFTDAFDCLPLGTIIDGKHLSLHGGLSPAVQAVEQLELIDRFQEIPSEGPFSDILWSDPDNKNLGFHVSPRGAGYIFGADIVERFLHVNNLSHLSRAHQLCMEGYQTLFNDTFSTVWSAPNYCFRFGNLAAVMVVDDNLDRSYNVFQAASPPSTNPLQSVTASSDVVDSGYFFT